MTATERCSERTAATARPTTPAPMTATSTSGCGREGGIEELAYFRPPARIAIPRRRIPLPVPKRLLISRPAFGHALGLRSGRRLRRAGVETGHFHACLTVVLTGLHDSRHRVNVEVVARHLNRVERAGDDVAVTHAAPELEVLPGVIHDHLSRLDARCN